MLWRADRPTDGSRAQRATDSPQPFRVVAAVVALICVASATAQASPIARPPLPLAQAPVAPAATLDSMPPAVSEAFARGLQKELRAHGYDTGPVDGRIGQRTRAAIRRYQADAGLPVDGIASTELLDHLKFALPKTYAFGQQVMGVALDVQRELARRNYYLGPHDGVAGPRTLRAVDEFLADARLPSASSINSQLLERIRQAPEEIKRR